MIIIKEQVFLTWIRFMFFNLPFLVFTSLSLLSNTAFHGTIFHLIFQVLPRNLVVETRAPGLESTAYSSTLVGEAPYFSASSQRSSMNPLARI